MQCVKLRRSTKLLFPVCITLVFAWMVSNMFEGVGQVSSPILDVAILVESKRGWVSLGVVTGGGHLPTEFHGRRRRYAARLTELRVLRTDFFPSVNHLHGGGGLGYRDFYNLRVPYWWLLMVAALLWIALWWRSRRKALATTSDAEPRAAGEVNS